MKVVPINQNRVTTKAARFGATGSTIYANNRIYNPSIIEKAGIPQAYTPVIELKTKDTQTVEAALKNFEKLEAEFGIKIHLQTENGRYFIAIPTKYELTGLKDRLCRLIPKKLSYTVLKPDYELHLSNRTTAKLLVAPFEDFKAVITVIEGWGKAIIQIPKEVTISLNGTTTSTADLFEKMKKHCERAGIKYTEIGEMTYQNVIKFFRKAVK
jgi:hypothetical protein